MTSWCAEGGRGRGPPTLWYLKNVDGPQCHLKYMRDFGEAWPNQAIVQWPFAQITWYHNIALLEDLKTEPKRLW